MGTATGTKILFVLSGPAASPTGASLKRLCLVARSRACVMVASDVELLWSQVSQLPWSETRVLACRQPSRQAALSLAGGTRQGFLIHFWPDYDTSALFPSSSPSSPKSRYISPSSSVHATFFASSSNKCLSGQCLLVISYRGSAVTKRLPARPGSPPIRSGLRP